MENYIINNKTVAILKKNNQTIIYNVDNIVVINKKVNKILKDNCLLYGCSMDGRKKSAQRILKKSYKLPLMINDNITLLQLNSLRKNECLFIVLNKIVDYEFNKLKLKIICVNNNIFSTNISKYSFENLMLNAIKLNNHLNWQKS